MEAMRGVGWRMSGGGGIEDEGGEEERRRSRALPVTGMIRSNDNEINGLPAEKG